MDSVPGSMCSSVFVFRRGAPGAAKVRRRAWGFCQPVPLSGVLHTGTHRTSQVSWRSVPYLCPVPRPRPDRQNLAFIGPVDAAPGTATPKAPALIESCLSGCYPRPPDMVAYISNQDDAAYSGRFILFYHKICISRNETPNRSNNSRFRCLQTHGKPQAALHTRCWGCG